MRTISELLRSDAPNLPAAGASDRSRRGSGLRLPVPGVNLGPKSRSSGGCRVDKTQHAFIIVHLSRDQDIEIVRQADQAAIKHPVSRCLYDCISSSAGAKSTCVGKGVLL